MDSYIFLNKFDSIDIEHAKNIVDLVKNVKFGFRTVIKVNSDSDKMSLFLKNMNEYNPLSYLIKNGPACISIPVSFACRKVQVIGQLVYDPIKKESSALKKLLSDPVKFFNFLEKCKIDTGKICIDSLNVYSDYVDASDTIKLYKKLISGGLTSQEMLDQSERIKNFLLICNLLTHLLSLDHDSFNDDLVKYLSSLPSLFIKQQISYLLTELSVYEL